MAQKTATKGAKKAVTKTKAVHTGDKKHRRRRRMTGDTTETRARRLQEGYHLAEDSAR